MRISDWSSDVCSSDLHILTAFRYLVDSGSLPWMNSKDMADRCNEMMRTLWDQARADALLTDAAQIVREVVENSGGEFVRDQIRTESTKDALLQRFNVVRQP